MRKVLQLYEESHSKHLYWFLEEPKRTPAFAPNHFSSIYCQQSWATIQNNLNGSMEGKPLDMDRLNDVDVHPIFALENFLGRLPTDEIYDTMKPALQLCTMLITEAHFLDFWVHIRYSRLRRNPITGMGQLEACADIPANAKDVVKAEMIELASRIRFLWAHALEEEEIEHAGVGGFFVDTASRLVEILQQELQPSEKVYTKKELQKGPQDFFPTIGISAEFFQPLMMCAHCPTVPDLIRTHIWFILAKYLTHEVAHAWYSMCHEHSGSGLDEVWDGCHVAEPLVFHDDVLPEVGIAWDNFWCDGYLEEMPGVPLEGQRSFLYRSYESLVRTDGPQYNLFRLIPDAFIEQWFLKETWANIPTLKAAGKLSARTFDRNIAVVGMDRWVNGEAMTVYHINGRVVVANEEDELHMALLEPGNKIPWPNDFRTMETLYRRVWAEENLQTRQKLLIQSSVVKGAHFQQESDCESIHLDVDSDGESFDSCESEYDPEEDDDINMEKRMYGDQVGWMASLRGIERAIRLQGLEPPTTIDGWKELHAAYMKDPFILKIAVRVDPNVPGRP